MVVSSGSGTIGVVVAGVGVVVTGGTGDGVVDADDGAALEGCTTRSHFDFSSITYRVPSAVLTSVSFFPSLSVAVGWPLS